MTSLNTIEERNQCYPRANVKVKDRLFRFIFQKKADLLDLYNAVNDSSYEDADELEVTTLEDAVYLTMKNDLSFIIGGTMNLYEHQSTYNPNMPIRGLMYITTLFRQYIEQNRINIYKEKQQMLPYPQYIVFYNGEKSEPDKTELRLTDAFEKIEGKEPCIECKAILLNINYGHNRKLMEKCRRLDEYAIFIDTVRKYQRMCVDINEAVNRAVNECIDKGILEDVLRNQRAEVVDMLLTTFDQEVYEKSIREDAREDGFEEGMKEGMKEGIKEGIIRCIEAYQECSVLKEDTLVRLMEKFALERQEAEAYIENYWKEK